MHRENWDDLRYVIAVAETGTVSAAARRLGVTHGTVLRRIQAFEDRHDRQVFDKGPTGYALRPDCAALIEAAHEVETAVMGVERMLGAGQGRLKGQLRITSTDTLCQIVLPQVVAEVARAHPGLGLTLVSANAHLDFTRAAIDITLRPSADPPEGLSSQRIGTLGFAAYRARGAADDLPWLMLEGPLVRSTPAAWLAQNVPPGARGPGSDTFLALRSFVALGMGQSFLPCFIADDASGLVRVPGAPRFEVPLWLACQPELRDSPRIRAVLTEMQAALAPHQDRLAGTA